MPRNRNRWRPDDVVIHWLKEPIPEEDIATIDGLRVTKPARTLLDLATVEPEHVVARALDDALRRRLVSLPFLERWLADSRRSKHRGAPMIRRLIQERATVGVTESELETELLTLVRKSGLPLPMLQYEVIAEGRFVARLDFAYPEQRVGIEADSFIHHDRRFSFDDERARGNRLEALGWRILRITSKHLKNNPQEVAEWIRRSLQPR